VHVLTVLRSKHVLAKCEVYGHVLQINSLYTPIC